MKCIIILIRYNHPVVYNPKMDKKDYNYTFPLGLAYISAVLKQNGHEVHCLNLNNCDGIADDVIKERLKKENYNVMITGGLSPYYPEIKACVRSVREYAPDIKIILGGGLISSQPEIMLNLLQPDFGVIGEGEQTVKELLECLEKNGDITTVNGLVFRDSAGNMVLTKPRDPIKNIDSLPWPDYEGLGFEEYLNHISLNYWDYYQIVDNPRVYPIISSRSCPFACTFCFHPIGKKYRQRSIDNIMEELEYAIKKYKINIIFFYDELFANDEERVKEFCKKFTDLKKTIPWDVKWFCQMRVDIIDEELIKTMYNAGCYLFSLGLESYSLKVLKSMRKITTPEQIDKALRIFARHKISVQGLFIFGDTAETVETYRETLEYWEKNQDILRGGVGLGFITLYQGSPIYKLAVKKGIIKDEIAFIEDRVVNDYILNPINFTDKMTDEEYRTMKLDLLEVSSVPRYYSYTYVNKKINGNFELHAKCPYCNETSVYKNYLLQPDFSMERILCRKCGARYMLLSKKDRLRILFFRVVGYKTLYNMNPQLKKVLKIIFRI